jgi:PAS domain S-box-containing protein
MSDGDAYTGHTSTGLLELSSELNQAGSIEDASVVAVRMLDLNFDAPLSAIWEYDEEGNELRPIAESTEAQEVIDDAPILPLDSLAGRVYRQNRPEAFNDVHEADGTYNSDTLVRSEILVPISDFGVLSVAATEVDAFTEKDSELAKLVASNLEATISRIRRHEELQTERDWTYTLFEGSNDAIFISDSDANFVQVNQAACELTGYAREELLSMRILDLHEEVDLHAYQDYHDQILAGEPATTETKLLRSDDSKIDVEFSNCRIERDGAAYIHTVARDVTEQRERRRRLNSFKSAIESASDGIAILENEEYTYVDQTHAEMYGFKDQDELLGQTWRDLYTDAVEIERIEDEALSALRSDGEWRGTVTASPEGRGEFPTELSLTRLEDDRIVCVVRDVSEKYRRQAELRENERRFESVFEDPEMLVALLETNGETIDVNETALDYVSNDKSDILGEPFWEGDWWSHSSDLQGDLKGWIERAAAGEYVSFQAEHPDRDGSMRFVTGTIRPVIGESGVESLVMSSQDITLREQRRRELETFRRAVEDAKDGFAILEDGEYTYIDDTHADMYGFDDTDQLIGNSWRMLYDEDEIERLESEAFPVLESEGHWRGKVTGSQPDGTTFPAEISLTTIDDGPLVCTVRDETDRQRRIRQIQQEQKRFNILSESLEEYTFVLLNDHGQIDSWNNRAADMFGYDEEAAIGMPAAELHPEQDQKREIADRLLKQASLAGESTHEGQRVRQDGSSFPAEVSYAPLQAEDGAFLGYGMVIRDLTDERQQQRRTERFVEESVDLVSILDRDGYFSYVSGSAEQVLGYDPTQLNQESIFDIIHPEDRERVMEAFFAAMEGSDSIVQLEFQAMDADDEWITVEARGRNLFDDGAIDGFLLYMRDISDVKEQTRKFESVFNQTFQLTGLLTQSGEILELNDPLTEFGGTGVEESRGTPLWECPLFAHSSEVQAQIRQAVTEASSGSLVRFNVEAEGVDGFASFDFSVKPISSQRREISFLIFEARDVTAQEQRRRHVQVLHRIMRHNLRNDLTKLRGYVDLLVSDTQTDTREQRAATLRDILDKWERMANKTQELQNILTSESALASHQSAQQIVENIQAKKEDEHTSANITITANQNIESRIPSDLEKAISELVENAIIANDTEHPSVQISVSQADERWAEVCVSDTGPGLPDMEKNLLETGEETPLSHGQGLGLWMVRALVTRVGGSISVETSDDGSEIRLEVPTRPALEDSQKPGIVS